MGQFSEILMDHFNSPRNCGRMEDPHLVGLAGTPGLGPYFAATYDSMRIQSSSPVSRLMAAGCPSRAGRFLQS